MAVIRIGKYQVVLDDEDLERVILLNWQAMKSDSRVYFKTTIKPYIYLHRYVMNASYGQQVDHKNADWLDNRKNNLRFCSQTQNNYNQRLSRKSTSGIKGVSWSLVSRKWRAYITSRNKQIHLGLFSDITDASIAHREAFLKIAKEFARL